jgi:acetyl esterase/lipase
MASPVPALRVSYKTVSSVSIPTDVYLPSLTESGPSPQVCPILIMIHGGAFMLGHAAMNNKDQIQDCLERGWIVLAIEHRLCPGVDVLEGPMTDVRDVLRFIQNGQLGEVLESQASGSGVQADQERILVMGTSSGGMLALCTVLETSVVSNYIS